MRKIGGGERSAVEMEVEVPGAFDRPTLLISGGSSIPSRIRFRDLRAGLRFSTFASSSATAGQIAHGQLRRRLQHHPLHGMAENIQHPRSQGLGEAFRHLLEESSSCLPVVRVVPSFQDQSSASADEDVDGRVFLSEMAGTLKGNVQQRRRRDADGSAVRDQQRHAPPRLSESLSTRAIAFRNLSRTSAYDSPSGQGTLGSADQRAK